MSLGKTKLIEPGYEKIYTVPTGKRAVVNVISNLINDSEILIAASDEVGVPASGEIVYKGEPYNLANQLQEQSSLPINSAFGDYSNTKVSLDNGFAVTIFEDALIATGFKLVRVFNTRDGSEQIIDLSNLAVRIESVCIFENTLAVLYSESSPSTSVTLQLYTRPNITTPFTPTTTITLPTVGLLYNDDTNYVRLAGDYILVGNYVNSVDPTIYGYKVSTGTTLQFTLSYSLTTVMACLWTNGDFVVVDNFDYLSRLPTTIRKYSSFSTTVSSINVLPPLLYAAFSLDCDKVNEYFCINFYGSNVNFNEKIFHGLGLDPYTYTTLEFYSKSNISSKIQEKRFPTSNDSLVYGYYDYNDTLMDKQGNVCTNIRNGDVVPLSRIPFFYIKTTKGWQDILYNNLIVKNSDSGLYRFAVSDSYVYEYKNQVLVKLNTYSFNAFNQDYNYTVDHTPISTEQIQFFEKSVDDDYGRIVIESNLIDCVKLKRKETYERTGLVLDEGESLYVAVRQTDDLKYTPLAMANFVVRGYEENI